MVVVMRAGMSAAHGARGATAAIATFYETLVMMAAGGLVAALGFALGGPSPSMTVTLPALGKLALPFYHLAGLFALGLGLAFLVVVLPPCFRRLSLMVSLPLPGVGPEALPRFSARTAGARAVSRRGILALPRPQSDPRRPRAGASGPVRLSQRASRGDRQRGAGDRGGLCGRGVAGRPGGSRGGAHGRAWPVFGHDLAVVAALALRLVWVAAELLAAAVLSGPWFRSRAAVPSEASSGPA